MQLRTDGVHRRESAGIGPVDLKVVPNECCLAWQVTMDQLICTSLSHTHYWHEGGMLKVPADVPIERVFHLKVDEEQCKHFTWIYLPPTTIPSLNIICRPYVLGDNVCCVFSSHSFWTPSSLDVPAGVTHEAGHTGFLIHLPSTVRALIVLTRRIQSFLSLADREVEFCDLTS